MTEAQPPQTPPEIRLTPSQQNAAIDSINVSMALRSGAGCGKTFVLALRFTELLKAYQGEDSPLSHFVALTFTEKAALEMQQRVRAMLHAESRIADPTMQSRMLEWIEELPEARISTIHSFCANLLRTHAIEAGVDPAFSVCADDLLKTQLTQDTCDRAALTAVEAGDEDLIEVIEATSYQKVVDLASEMVTRREVWSIADYATPEVILDHWHKCWQNARQAAFERLDNASGISSKLDKVCAVQCADPDDKLLPLSRRAIDLAQLICSGDDRTAGTFAELAEVKFRTYGTMKAWGSKENAKELRDSLKEVQAELAEFAIYAEELGEQDKRASKTLSVLANLAQKANDAYDIEKRKRGMLDFTDLTQKTHALLTGNKPLRNRLACNIHQLLVDECQDTDAFQLELLNTLVSFDDSDTDGAKAFIVGDGKQSIYKFRGADVEVFENMCAALPAQRSEVLDLSFRTHAGGVEFVNHVFAQLMGEHYQPIHAHRSVTPPQPSVEIILASCDGSITNAAQAGSLQASVTAQRIEEMITNKERRVWDGKSETWRPVEPRDVAILFSRMTNSLEYERELQNRNIPYYVVAGTGFFRQQEVYDILNALRVIDNPLDDTALIGVLRSSLFALDDNALMHIAEAIGRGPYLPVLSRLRDDDEFALSERLPAEDMESLILAGELLGRLAACKDAIATDEIIQRLLDATGYEGTLLAQFQGKRMLGNVRQLMDAARTAYADAMCIGDFISQMNQCVLSQSRYEEAVVAGEGDNVVRLMTTHKSKGLEFPVVIIPDLNAKKRGCTNSLLHRGRDWKYTLIVNWDSDDADLDNAEKPLSYRAAVIAENDELENEDIRRLYVAATRHKDHLVLIGADWRNKDGSIHDKGSYLQRLDGVMNLSDALTADGLAPYGDEDRYNAQVRVMLAEPAQCVFTGNAQARKLIKADTPAQTLADTLMSAGSAGDNSLPLVGMVPAQTGNAELAVTALGDFARCEMLYRWRYELRATPPYIPSEHDKQTCNPQAGIHPATLGTFFHRCMELLDFASPQPAGRLASTVANEMALETEDFSPNLSGLTEQLQDMIDLLQATDLPASLTEAQNVLRELDFVVQLDQLTLRGQIDLLYKDKHGNWHVVDYKSDRLSPDHIEQHSSRYQLQMLAYSLAAEKYLGSDVQDVTLYYLRPGLAHKFEITPQLRDETVSQLGKLASRLVSARRAGDFAICHSRQCEQCQYLPLCRRLTGWDSS